MRHALALLILCICIPVLANCSAVREVTKSSRSATEQLLLGQAIQVSLAEASFPLPTGTAVTVGSIGLTNDHLFFRGMLIGWLAEQGIQVRPDNEEAPFHVEAVVQVLGSEIGDSFFGMPEVSGGLFPLAIPELTVFRAKRQRGYARFSLDVFQTSTRQLAASTPWYEGSAYHDHFTVFFIFTFVSTDLAASP